MTIKNVPMRMCISCREMKPKQELIRFVKSGDNVSLDKTGKMSGRGAYVCNNSDCIKKALKTRALNRAYKTPINQEVYDTLMESYGDGK